MSNVKRSIDNFSNHLHKQLSLILQHTLLKPQCTTSRAAIPNLFFFITHF